MAPAQRVAGRVGRRVGQDREDEGLRVPERVAVVARAGQALRRDRPALAARAGLQDVEQAEADRLLELRVALELHVGAGPEAVEHLALGRAQPVEACVPGLGDAAADLGADGRHRPVPGPAVGEVLQDPQRPPARDVGGDRDPAGVDRGLDVDRRAVRAVHHMVHRGRHAQPAAARAVDEQDELVVLVVLLADERVRHARRGARIVAPVGRRLAVQVGDELGLHDEAGVAVDRLDLVEDRRGAALGERHDARRGHAHLAARGRAPVRAAAQDARAEVEHALVLEQLAVADVEQLVVDEQADELAVGDAEQRLARLGVAVGALGVRQRADLVEAVEVRPRHSAGVALVEVAAQADVAVGEREQRLALGQQVEVELGLAQDPGLDRERGMVDHAARRRRRRAAPRGRGRRRSRRGPSARPRGRRGRRRRRGRSRRPARPRRPRPRPRTPPPSTPRRRAVARPRGTCPARACPGGPRGSRRCRRRSPRTGRGSRPPRGRRGSSSSRRRPPGAGRRPARRGRSGPSPRRRRRRRARSARARGRSCGCPGRRRSRCRARRRGCRPAARSHARRGTSGRRRSAACRRRSRRSRRR